MKARCFILLFHVLHVLRTFLGLDLRLRIFEKVAVRVLNETKSEMVWTLFALVIWIERDSSEHVQKRLSNNGKPCHDCTVLI